MSHLYGCLSLDSGDSEIPPALLVNPSDVSTIVSFLTLITVTILRNQLPLRTVQIPSSSWH